MARDGGSGSSAASVGGFAGFAVGSGLQLTGATNPVLGYVLMSVGGVTFAGALVVKARRWWHERGNEETAPISEHGTLRKLGTRYEEVEKSPQVRTVRWQQSGQDVTVTPETLEAKAQFPDATAKSTPSGSLEMEVIRGPQSPDVDAVDWETQGRAQYVVEVHQAPVTLRFTEPGDLTVHVDDTRHPARRC